MLNFKLWLESKSKDKIIFLDLDETLVHELKEHKNSILSNVPHEDYVILYYKNDTILLFPRPNLIEFLDEVSKLADLYIYTRNIKKLSEKILDKLKINKYFKDIYSTRDIVNVNKELDLSKKSWILIDNLDLDTLETANKMANLAGDSDLDNIKRYNNRFILVNSWFESINKNKDHELMKIIPEIKHKLK